MFKANPYVYPYTLFADLSNKNILDNFVGGHNIDIDGIKRYLSYQIIQVDHNEQNTAEKILEIFLDDKICYGSKEFIKQNYNKWIDKINNFVKKDKKIELSILGFPFKVPVPLKTNRKFPDMGEVLSLHRLNNIAELINKIYQPGASINIFTEGVFGKFVGEEEEEGDKYRDFLIKLKDLLGFTNLHIEDLRVLEKYVPKFQKEFKQEEYRLKKLYEQQDDEYLKKYQGTFPSVKRIINTRDYELELLMDAYNEKLKDEDVNEQVKILRKYLDDQTHQAIFSYHAYLDTRSNFDALAKHIGGVINLSVSPKANRLGIFPINKNLNKLPYHGVPVWHQKDKKFTIEYLIDIRRSSDKFEKIYFEDDEEEDIPFFYTKS